MVRPYTASYSGILLSARSQYLFVSQLSLGMLAQSRLGPLKPPAYFSQGLGPAGCLQKGTTRRVCGLSWTGEKNRVRGMKGHGKEKRIGCIYKILTGKYGTFRLVYEVATFEAVRSALCMVVWDERRGMQTWWTAT
eukprot:scaffold295925_cov21-Tisochrysis_lutea.AAC.1